MLFIRPFYKNFIFYILCLHPKGILNKKSIYFKIFKDCKDKGKLLTSLLKRVK
jgi:hypothetical protein